LFRQDVKSDFFVVVIIYLSVDNASTGLSTEQAGSA